MPENSIDAEGRMQLQHSSIVSYAWVFAEGAMYSFKDFQPQTEEEMRLLNTDKVEVSWWGELLHPSKGGQQCDGQGCERQTAGQCHLWKRPWG